MRARGFTLVEVMVALAVVAIALPALLTALSQQVDDTGYLRDKSFAQMIAANRLAEMRIVVAATRDLQSGKDSGQLEMVDRDWFWWLQTSATEVEQYYRVEIAVALDEEQREQPLYTLIAFMSADLQEDASPLGGAGGGGADDNDPEGADQSAGGRIPRGDQRSNEGGDRPLLTPGLGQGGGASGGR